MLRADAGVAGKITKNVLVAGGSQISPDTEDVLVSKIACVELLWSVARKVPIVHLQYEATACRLAELMTDIEE